jgi:hypothetical protein
VAEMAHETRVLLDPGAQIVEMTNEEVATTWLGCVPSQSVHAAVYCNERDEIMVVDRIGHKELLRSSSYATQLDTCLVFLDDVHTRGTDLRLPKSYRAAVTLGANLTKDRMMQGESTDIEAWGHCIDLRFSMHETSKAGRRTVCRYPGESRD